MRKLTFIRGSLSSLLIEENMPSIQHSMKRFRKSLCTYSSSVRFRIRAGIKIMKHLSINYIIDTDLERRQIKSPRRYAYANLIEYALSFVESIPEPFIQSDTFINEGMLNETLLCIKRHNLFKIIGLRISLNCQKGKNIGYNL